jgi:hypothetical protein
MGIEMEAQFIIEFGFGGLSAEQRAETEEQIVEHGRVPLQLLHETIQHSLSKCKGKRVGWRQIGSKCENIF